MMQQISGIILDPSRGKMEVSMEKLIAVVRGCTGCDTCRWLCRAGAITFDHDGAHIAPEKCVGCGVCVDNCQSFAIRMKSREGKES